MNKYEISFRFFFSLSNFETKSRFFIFLKIFTFDSLWYVFNVIFYHLYNTYKISKIHNMSIDSFQWIFLKLIPLHDDIHLYIYILSASIVFPSYCNATCNKWINVKFLNIKNVAHCISCKYIYLILIWNFYSNSGISE